MATVGYGPRLEEADVYDECDDVLDCIADGNTHTHTHMHTHTRTHTTIQPFNGPLSGNKHSPTHTRPDRQTSFINFLHLLRSIASSLFN